MIWRLIEDVRSYVINIHKVSLRHSMRRICFGHKTQCSMGMKMEGLRLEGWLAVAALKRITRCKGWFCLAELWGRLYCGQADFRLTIFYVKHTWAGLRLENTLKLEMPVVQHTSAVTVYHTGLSSMCLDKTRARFFKE